MLNRVRQSGGGLRRDFALKFVIVALLVAATQLALDYRNVQRVQLDRVAQQTSAVADSFRIRAELDPAFSLAVATTLADWQVRRRPGLLGVYFVDPKGAVVGQAECEGGADIRQILDDTTIRTGLAHSFDGRSGSGTGVTGNDRSVWTHIAPLPKLAVSALVVADLEPARKAIARELFVTATRDLAVLAVLIATLYALMRGGVLRPISRLAAAVERSGMVGRFDPPRPMPSNEIGMLATLFGDVFESLSRSTAENRMLAQVANATHAGVLIADGAGKVTWMNAGFERMTGFGRDDILGRTPDENYSRRGQPIAALSALGQCVRFRHGYNVEIADYASDGREFWATVEVRPIHDDAGTIESFIVVETDITVAKDTEAALNRSQRQLRERIDELQTAKAALENERARLASTEEECAEAKMAASGRARAAVAVPDAATPRAQPEEVSLDVLLAEDQPVNQKLMKAVMERLGHRLTIANNGVEALDRLGERPFDLILMDIQMPELDGISATKLIRSSDEPWRNIPIVAVTAHTMDGHRETYFAAGMNGFVAKPFKIDVLVAEMARVTARGTDTIGAELQAEQAISGAERTLQREQKAILSAMLDELDSLTG